MDILVRANLACPPLVTRIRMSKLRSYRTKNKIMNSYNKLYFLLLLGLFSCTKALDVADPESLSPEQVFAEVGGFESILFSAYNRVHNFEWMGQNGIIAPDVLADNLDFNNRTFNYESEYVNAVRAHMGRWELYVGINDLNLIFSKIDDLTDVTAAEEDLRQQIKGEAFFLRALYYHDLAKVYGYEPGKEVNDFNLTVPIRTTPTEEVSDALVTNPRATNTELYELIESDLNQAINLLSDNVIAPLRVGKATVHALMARVQLYKSNFAEAARQADQALTQTTAELTTVENFEASWEMTPHPESLFEAEIRATDWSTVDGANRSICTMTNNTSSSSQYILVGSPELLAVLDREPNDIRHSIWTVEEDIPNGTRKCNKWRGEQGDFRENIPIIRYAEVLLIAAEGYVRSGDDTNAQTRINELRMARGLVPTALTGTALIDLIMQERRIELALEGHRWFDLKRLGKDIPKTNASNVPNLSYTDFRILSDIPQSELSLNELLTQNPGY